MTDFLESSAFFGLLISLLSYGIGVILKKKLKLAIFNPLLISIVLTIAILTCLHIDYAHYYAGAKYISYLLTPATVCFAFPLYEQLSLLKHNWKAVLSGVLSGVLSSLGVITGMTVLFGMNHREYVTMLPKSITTAIGIGISEKLGGFVSITTAMIIITGVLGNMLGEFVFRLFRIREPLAQGVALGTASHAVGTAKAMELGDAAGAVSSLALVVSGLVTVAGAAVFARFM